MVHTTTMQSLWTAALNTALVSPPFPLLLAARFDSLAQTLSLTLQTAPTLLVIQRDMSTVLRTLKACDLALSTIDLGVAPWPRGARAIQRDVLARVREAHNILVDVFNYLRALHTDVQHLSQLMHNAPTATTKQATIDHVEMVFRAALHDPTYNLDNATRDIADVMYLVVDGITLLSQTT